MIVLSLSPACESRITSVKVIPPREAAERDFVAVRTLGQKTSTRAEQQAGRDQQLGACIGIVWTLSRALGPSKENIYALESLKGDIV